uniref:Uncharacterized protein n=1 Tax=Nicotiana tabacum TaxID=4097 RepID=A0A1S4D425_TOBAC|nr:PREDICTED: uncharacterized protein LOC107825794 [Nicotiana tabacum]
MTMGHSPSLPSFSEQVLKEARELKSPDIDEGSGAGDPFRDCFTGVDDGSDIGDASLLLEEAQRFITRVMIFPYLVSLFFSILDSCFLLCRPLVGFESILASVRPSSGRSQVREMPCGFFAAKRTRL